MLLADHASSPAAKERCLAVQPLDDAEDIRLLQAQTSAACKLITLKGSPSFGGIADVGASLSRADRGGCLSPEELLRVATVLKAARTAKEYAEGDAVESGLDIFFRQLTPNKFFEERIFTSILSKDEIADAASSELASIRRKIRQQSSKIRESLQRIITSPTYAKILQEPIVTIRSDRFVVPVKAECKSQLPGLVHDVSSSGSTFFIEPMSAVNGNNELRGCSSRNARRSSASWPSFPPRRRPGRRASTSTMRCSSRWTASLPARSCRSRCTASSRSSGRTESSSSSARAIR